jgi:hypothetical protein
VATDTLEFTGYEHQKTRRIYERKEVGPKGRSREVVMSSVLSVYATTSQSPTASVEKVSDYDESFLLFSTPDVNEFGLNTNPYTALSDEEIVGLFDIDRNIAYTKDLGKYATIVFEERDPVPKSVQMYRVREDRDGAVRDFIVHVTTLSVDGGVIHVSGKVPEGTSEGGRPVLERLIKAIDY